MIINHNHSKNYIGANRNIKTLELLLIAVLDIFFFYIIAFNAPLRQAVFGNKYLFMICLLMWTVMIVSIIFILIDFTLLKKTANSASELSQIAYCDVLTGLPNRHSIDMMINLQNSDFDKTNIGCVLVTITSLSKINDSEGHSAGDKMIHDFCQLLVSVSNRYGFVGRNGGNDFLGIFENCDEDTVKRFIAELDEQTNMYNIGRGGKYLEFDYSYALNSIEHKNSVSDLLTIVYRRIKE